MQNAPSQHPAVFTPEAVAKINRAYLEACHLVAGEGGEALRFALADRIMYLARSGETDEHRLCNLSVEAVLGRPPTDEPPPARFHDA